MWPVGEKQVIIDFLLTETPLGWLEIHNAVLLEDTTSLRREIEFLDDINIANDLLNALQLACLMRNEEIVKILINVPGIDLNMRSREFPAPLTIACLARTPNIVALLLEKGADISISSLVFGGSPLMIACLYRFTEVAELLFQEMRKSDVVSNAVALRKPQENGNNRTLAIAKILIESVLDLDAKNIALLKAVDLDYPQMGKLLLENGAVVDATIDGYTVLFLASVRGYVEFVRILVQAGADVKMKSTHDQYPLIAAVVHSNESSFYLQIAKILLESGAGDEYCDESQRKNAIEACEEGNYRLLQHWVLEAFDDFNKANHY